MHRFGKTEGSDKVELTVYSGLVYTGPGKSFWYESFWEPDPYVQVHLVHEKTVSVPRWFADLVREAESSKDRRFVEREVRRLGILEV